MSHAVMRATMAAAMLLSISYSQSEGAQAVQFETQRLTPSDLAEGGGSGFGRGVAIWRDYIVVGAPRDAPQEDPWLASGAVYVFQFEDGVWVEQAKLLGSQTNWNDQLGWSVAIEGDLIVAGAPHLTLEGSGLEAKVYVFRRDDNGTPDDGADDVWIEEAILAPDPTDRQYSDGFGASVAVSGDTIVAGAAGAGVIDFIEFERAYVFRRDCTGWVREAILVGADAEAGDRFGTSVSISGDTVLIGASWHERCPDKDRRRSGAAYVFRKGHGKWVQDDKICAADVDEGDFFGDSVALGPTRAIVGTKNNDDLGTNSGTAYLFRMEGPTWAQETKFLGSDTVGLDSFGWSVAIGADFAVVGAIGDDDACPENPSCDSGSAYLFRFDGTGWEQQHKLLPSDGRPSGQFGSSVSISGGYAVVGGPASAYVYVVLGDRTDLFDFAGFQRCFGRGGSLNECAVFDLVPDARIDLKDNALFLQTLHGP